MKKLFLLLSFTLGLAFVAAPVLTQSAAYAQAGMSKKERKKLEKKWKKQAKNYKKNPLALRNKIESYEGQIEDLNNRIKELTQKYTELQAELDRKEAELRRCSYSVDSCKSEFDRLQAAYEAQKRVQKTDVMPGVIFRVQVGAYEQFDITDKVAQANDENFAGESVDNLNKYMMGKFRDYNLAEAFRDDIKKLGIRDAFVVAYSDGIRIDIKEALQMQGGQGPTGDTYSNDEE